VQREPERADQQHDRRRRRRDADAVAGDELARRVAPSAATRSWRRSVVRATG
jgi:hypothetical protein